MDGTKIEGHGVIILYTSARLPVEEPRQQPKVAGAIPSGRYPDNISAMQMVKVPATEALPKTSEPDDDVEIEVIIHKETPEEQPATKPAEESPMSQKTTATVKMDPPNYRPKRTRLRAFINLMSMFGALGFLIGLIYYGYKTDHYRTMVTPIVDGGMDQPDPPTDMAALTITSDLSPAKALTPPPATADTGKVAPAPTPAKEETFTYKLAEGQWVRSAMMACHPKQKEKHAMDWFRANNPGIKNPDKVQAGQTIKVPCQLTTNMVWWGQARGACLNGLPEAKKDCLKAAQDWLK